MLMVPLDNEDWFLFPNFPLVSWYAVNENVIQILMTNTGIPPDSQANVHNIGGFGCPRIT